MHDLSGIGKSVNINSESTMTCSMVASSNSQGSVWKCQVTDCPHYGKWYCPFSGW